MFALSQVHFLVNRSHFRVSHHFARLQWLAPSRPWQGHGIQASRGLADGSDVTGTEKTRLFGNLDAGTTKSRDGSTKWCPKYLQMVITMRIWGLLSDNPKMCATFGWPDDVGVGWFDRKITHDEFGRWFRVDLTSEFQWRLYDDRLWDTQSVKVYLDISRLISSGTSPPISTYLSTYIIYIYIYNIYIYIYNIYIIYQFCMDYLFFRFPWTCLSPRSCVKAEGDLDGLYAAMGLGYFARCAMERAQWGAGSWVEPTNSRVPWLPWWMVEGLINVLPLQWMFGTKKSRSRGVWACSLVLASFWRVISMWRCITWQGSKRKYGLEAAPKCSMNTWVVASCLCFMSVSAYIP